ncbi:hypothetical protein BFP72_07815 [Reichenbachiella sp. 5M10]|uniref:hypothetical protein n=1 Tax=Reichenbachiella sp. 5M10 TaxID=1889772 RepID=UPI000C157EA5|nr:hypothetical protein [Reichenbachiella sp. 5M10]PIB35311.1 hypothetical protein BFP72_07815 [Reichenbachiella sp. 5M10]
MELQHAFVERISKTKALEIADHVMEHPRHLPTLVQYFMGDDYRSCQNAAWVLSTIGEKQPLLLEHYVGAFIDHLDSTPIDGVKRNILRLLEYQEIPESHQGKLVEYCFQYLTDQKEAIAVQAFSMSVLANLCQLYPDLKHELRLIIEDLMQFGSAAIRARGRRVLKQIEK